MNIKTLWDKSSQLERLSIVYNIINTWLPIRYHDFKFIESDFDELDDIIKLWMEKYYINFIKINRDNLLISILEG